MSCGGSIRGATYDAPGVHGPHMTTSPDVFICGLRGNGKSFAAKVMALREIEAGRHVIVQSDREGEWGRVANHVGARSSRRAAAII